MKLAIKKYMRVNEFMLKGKIARRLAILTLGMGSTTVAHADWHYATITLPRTNWWYTTTRSATSTKQGTGVNRPSYMVLAHITTDVTSEQLSANVTHPAGRNTTRWHYTNRKNTNVKACFRSSFYNLHTNIIDLRWKP